jgi:hypothetical protein
LLNPLGYFKNRKSLIPKLPQLSRSDGH